MFFISMDLENFEDFTSYLLRGDMMCVIKVSYSKWFQVLTEGNNCSRFVVILQAAIKAINFQILIIVR